MHSTSPDELASEPPRGLRAVRRVRPATGEVCSGEEATLRLVPAPREEDVAHFEEFYGGFQINYTAEGTITKPLSGMRDGDLVTFSAPEEPSKGRLNVGLWGWQASEAIQCEGAASCKGGTFPVTFIASLAMLVRECRAAAD